MPFDPATIALQRELLDKTSAQLDSDKRGVARLPEGSRSKLAEKLRTRITTNTAIVGDLTALLRFMEGLNREHAADELAEPYDAADLGPEYSDGYPLPGEREGGEPS